jgi:hypothetical protein
LRFCGCRAQYERTEARCSYQIASFIPEAKRATREAGIDPVLDLSNTVVVNMPVDFSFLSFGIDTTGTSLFVWAQMRRCH